MKVRKITQWVVEHEDKSYPVEFEPVTDPEPQIYKRPDGSTVIGYLAHDDDPLDPRKEYDNLGVMICWHRRYSLGDKHSYENPDALWTALLGEEDAERIEAESNAAYQQWAQAHPKTYEDPQFQSMLRESDQQKRQKIREVLAAKGFVILSLYLMDHSGISMSTSSFNDPWDSGQVGFIYTSPELAEKLGAPRDSWERQLKGEVQEYDQYLRGNCYGACAQVINADGTPGESEKSWGSIGEDQALDALSDLLAGFGIKTPPPEEKVKP